jgi:hypothetical protein
MYICVLALKPHFPAVPVRIINLFLPEKCRYFHIPQASLVVFIHSLLNIFYITCDVPTQYRNPEWETIYTSILQKYTVCTLLEKPITLRERHILFYARPFITLFCKVME